MILIIDDTPEIVMWLVRVTEDAGYYSDFAMDALVASYKMERIYYSLALVDIILPGGINGNELARRVKEMPEPYCHTPLVAMTGGTGDDVSDLFVHVLRKPFLPRQYREVIERFARPPIRDLHAHLGEPDADVAPA